MISGTADDRLAFVIETEAELEGIKKARAEVIGIASDATNAAQAMALADAKSANSAAAASRAIEHAFGLRQEAARAAAAAEEDLGVSTIAGTRAMSTWSALNAEASGHVGEHALSMGRLEYRMGSAAAEILGMNRIAELASASLLKFSVGTIETVGILGGIYAVTFAFEKLTEGDRELMKASDKVVASLLEMAKLEAFGVGGKFLEDIEKMKEAAPVALKWADALNWLARSFTNLDFGLFSHLEAKYEDKLIAIQGARSEAAKKHAEAVEKDKDAKDKERAGDLATLVAFNAHDEAARQSALKDIRKYQADLAALGEGEYKERAELVKRIEQLEAPFKAEQKKYDAEIQKNISKLGGLGHINAADVVEREQKRAATAESKADEFHARLQAKALELSLRTIDQETAAKIAASEAEYMRTQREIAAMDVKEARKTTLLHDAELLRAAQAAQIREDARDKEERARDKAEKTAAEKQAAADKKKLAQMKQNVAAIVDTQGSVLLTLKKIALEPIISHLEGMAADQAVAALAAFPDFPAMAAHAAAAAAATTAAREVAGWAGSGTSGGGGSSSGGHGGGSAGGSSTFTPQSGTQGQGSLTIQLYSLNPYGAEQIQQLQFNLNRAGILKVPIPISPTTQLRTA